MPRYSLRFRCPFCPNSTEVNDWKHAQYGESQEIDEDGNVWWTKGYKVGSLADLIFKCRHCPNDYSYNRFALYGPERTYEIFKILCLINEEIGDKKFIGNLIHNVFKRAYE